ncbi:MAG: oxidoreductase [Salinisphaeraceae bacterium]|nr:oxidoreductase [Salinisphaeraceae bacterium]
MSNLSEALSFSGQIAFVTGAGQGVGRQTALTLAAHGARVVVNDYFDERAQVVTAEIKSAGGKALALAGDVTNYEGMQAAFAHAAETLGAAPTILVNNAGNAGATDSLSDLAPFWETGPDEWQRWFGTNLYGVLNCCRAAVPGMIEAQQGRIITVVSDAGRVGEPHLAVYSGAKAGAAGFMRGLAKAVGRYGITANCVALGGVATPGVQDMIDNEDAVKQMLKHYVIRRLGQPDDAANMIVFLASAAASWVTGQTYPVNGGYSFAV